MANGQPSTPVVVSSVLLVGVGVGVGAVVVVVAAGVGVGGFAAVDVIVAGVVILVVVVAVLVVAVLVVFVLVVVFEGGAVVVFIGVSADAELVIPAFHRAQVCFTHTVCTTFISCFLRAHRWPRSVSRSNWWTTVDSRSSQSAIDRWLSRHRSSSDRELKSQL